MKKIEGFTVRKMGNTAFIVAESVDLINFDRLVTLNASAAYVWQSLPDADFSIESIADLLTERYDVERSVALKDAADLAATWLRAGVIRE